MTWVLCYQDDFQNVGLGNIWPDNSLPYGAIMSSTQLKASYVFQYKHEQLDLVWALKRWQSHDPDDSHYIQRAL